MVLFLITTSCSDKTDVFKLKQEQVPLSENIKITSKNKEDLNLDIGLWMFNKKTPEISSIANWIGIQLKGKVILEPINIIWLDFKATNKVEAEENIVNFLKANNFLMRSGSSTGYYGLFENDYWIPQFMETWSDNANPTTINNHGRIFIAHEIKDNSNNSFFVSTGAFSIENESHHLISFRDALKDFKPVIDWSVSNNSYQAKNIILSSNYTTDDHNGIKIFTLN
ncbi:hypothetical protein [Polaribacter ponticola]|uniref:Uncharacterized protein n=1 Tax=Polaribacter ponticola TaxID=2978475 RepID=A0ABT5S9V3_9FLAO|nr:hypothetical protein [Polaribacter sp. MSW5]MDD7914870.1 hypothetical protein [Polaribacter sp. MSW5]